jgi:hypothetical protein
MTWCTITRGDAADASTLVRLPALDNGSAAAWAKCLIAHQLVRATFESGSLCGPFAWSTHSPVA